MNAYMERFIGTVDKEVSRNYIPMVKTDYKSPIGNILNYYYRDVARVFSQDRILNRVPKDFHYHSPAI